MSNAHQTLPISVSMNGNATYWRAGAFAEENALRQ
jgi:hypothetical protein